MNAATGGAGAMGAGVLRAAAGAALDSAALAADLGYADQAHLTRDFTATLGVPPSRYACRGATASGAGSPR